MEPLVISLSLLFNCNFHSFVRNDCVQIGECVQRKVIETYSVVILKAKETKKD